jgi:hypothetical protein
LGKICERWKNPSSCCLEATLGDFMAFDRCYWLPALKVAVALGTLAGTAELPGTAARAQPAPWCANLGGRDGGWDCGYYTFDQCMATARGLGGSCAPNPRALAAPKPPPRRVRR